MVSVFFRLENVIKIRLENDLLFFMEKDWKMIKYFYLLTQFQI